MSDSAASPQRAHYLIQVFTEHRLASNLLMLMLILAGIWTFSQIKVQGGNSNFPPTVITQIVWPGASAEDMERLVTEPVELQLRGLQGMLHLTSETVDSFTTVRASFVSGTDMREAVDKVRQRVSQTRDLPPDIETPIIKERIDINLVAAVLISGKSSMEELIPIARQIERELIARGVDDVEMEGMPESEIAIQIDSKTLYQLGVPLNVLAQKVLDNSFDAPAGSAGSGQLERQIRSLHQRRSAEGFEQLPIVTQAPGEEPHLTYLGDIATIERRPVADQLRLEQAGTAAIGLKLNKLPDSNVLDEAKILYDWYQDNAELLKLQGVEVTIWAEAWRFARQSLKIVMENGLSGLVLVIAALFLFLNGRVAGWVTAGIPISFMGGLALFYFLGGAIDIVSLIGMVMALGIVVDDAIVVGEHAQTRFDAGASPAEAAALGAQSMFPPVMASSLTTLAAFLPLLVIEDSPVKAIPLLMVCVLLASLVECFLIMPGHLRHSFENVKRGNPSKMRRKFDLAFNRFREEVFMPALSTALANRRAVLALAGCLFLIAIALLASGRVKPQLNMNIGFEAADVHMQFAANTPEQQKQKFLAELERAMEATNQEFGGNIIENHVRKYNWSGLENKSRSGKQYASIMAALVPPDERTVSVSDFSSAWQEKVTPTPWVEELQFVGGSEDWPDLQLYFSGDDPDSLQMAAEELTSILGTVAGVSNIYHDLPKGKEQWVFTLSTQGRAAGLSAADIGRQIRSSFEGYRVQLLTENDSELEVRVSLPREEQFQLATLSHLPIATPSGEVVPLASVAQLSAKRGIESINHRNGRNAVNVYGHTDRRIVTPMSVIAELEQEVIPGLIDRHGIQYGLGIGSEIEARIFREMKLGALIGLSLIYMILAWIFASWTWPLAVMVAIPLGLTGGIAGLQIMGMNLSAMAIMGLFTLTGVIVNDSIILINEYKLNHSTGMDSHRALLRACRSRLRPVILTSITTMGGLAPLIFETSPIGQILIPLAVVIVFGLLYGTTLILFVVPSVLSVIETLNDKVAARNESGTAPTPYESLFKGLRPGQNRAS